MKKFTLLIVLALLMATHANATLKTYTLTRTNTSTEGTQTAYSYNSTPVGVTISNTAEKNYDADGWNNEVGYNQDSNPKPNYAKYYLRCSAETHTITLPQNETAVSITFKGYAANNVDNPGVTISKINNTIVENFAFNSATVESNYTYTLNATGSITFEVAGTRALLQIIVVTDDGNTHLGDGWKVTEDFSQPKIGQQISFENGSITMTFGGSTWWDHIGSGVETANWYQYDKDGTTDETINLKLTDQWKAPAGANTAFYYYTDENTRVKSSERIKIPGYDYYVTGNEDIKDENRLVYRLADKYSDNAKTPRNAIPTFGTYYVFEPTQNGKLQLYSLMPGCVGWDPSDLDGSVIRSGKVSIYHTVLMDESGKALTTCSTPVTAEPYTLNYYSSYTDENNNTPFQLYFDKVIKQYNETTPSQPIEINAGLRSFLVEDNLGAGVMKPWRNKVVTDMINEWKSLGTNATGTVQKVFYNEGENTYCVLFDANVMMEYELQAGKTYVFCSLGFPCYLEGFNFVTDGYNNSNTSRTATLTEETTTLDDGFYKSVTLNRTFKKGQWATICLPFSLTIEKFRSAFGANSFTVEFNKVENGTAIFDKHIYNQMLCAGVPYYIYIDNDNDVQNPTFENVTVEVKNAGDWSNLKYRSNVVNSTSFTDQDWRPVNAGGYQTERTLFTTTTTMPQGSYFMGTSGSKTGLYRVNVDNKTIGNFRAYLKKDGTSVNAIEQFDMEDMLNNETTGIGGVVSYYAPMRTTTAVYTLDGRQVRASGNLDSLPKGIYIVNGQKHIVK